MIYLIEATVLAMVLLFIHEYYKEEYNDEDASSSNDTETMNTIFPTILLVHYSFIFLMTIYPYIKSHALR